MNHYISVLVPMASGRWHAFFPDFPACEAEAYDLDLTAMHAARALAHHADTSPGRFGSHLRREIYATLDRMRRGRQRMRSIGLALSSR
jgi:hypothetical protein